MTACRALCAPAALLATAAMLLLPATAAAAPPVCDAEWAVSTPQARELFLYLPDRCRDPDTSDLSFTIVTEPAHGVLVGPSSYDSIIYTPETGFSGTDSFAYKASDGTDESGVVNVTITVVPNQPPECDTPISFEAEPDVPTPTSRPSR